MAEFSEVMRQWYRMCDLTGCDDCPLSRLSDNFSCTMAAKCDAKAAEEIIMRWAAEHPEPVYPTWREWLLANRIIGDADSDYATGLLMRCKRIPADIAQKLGIEPKEGA